MNYISWQCNIYYFFSYGEDGFHTEIVRRSVARKQQQKCQNVSIREFYAYQLYYRTSEGHTLL